MLFRSGESREGLFDFYTHIYERRLDIIQASSCRIALYIQKRSLDLICDALRSGLLFFIDVDGFTTFSSGFYDFDKKFE